MWIFFTAWPHLGSICVNIACNICFVFSVSFFFEHQSQFISSLHIFNTMLVYYWTTVLGPISSVAKLTLNTRPEVTNYADPGTTLEIMVAEINIGISKNQVESCCF